MHGTSVPEVDKIECKCTGFIPILARFQARKTTKYAFFEPILQVLVYQYN